MHSSGLYLDFDQRNISQIRMDEMFFTSAFGLGLDAVSEVYLDLRSIKTFVVLLL